MLPPQNVATLEAVESLIQYKFKSQDILWEALHTTALVPGSGSDNKRLAVIGDSVLNLGLAEDWYKGGTPRVHWASQFQTGVGSNANLDRCGRSLGLERFILGAQGRKAVADTVEAILGAIYLDTNRDMAKCKDVMEALELMPAEQRLDREFEAEGLVILDKEIVVPSEVKRPLPSGPKPKLRQLEFRSGERLLGPDQKREAILVQKELIILGEGDGVPAVSKKRSCPSPDEGLRRSKRLADQRPPEINLKLPSHMPSPDSA